MDQLIKMVNFMLYAFYLLKKNGRKKEMGQIPLCSYKRE